MSTMLITAACFSPSTLRTNSELLSLQSLTEPNYLLLPYKASFNSSRQNAGIGYHHAYCSHCVFLLPWHECRLDWRRAALPQTVRGEGGVYLSAEGCSEKRMEDFQSPSAAQHTRMRSAWVRSCEVLGRGRQSQATQHSSYHTNVLSRGTPTCMRPFG